MGAALYNDCEKGDEMYYELYVDSLLLVNLCMNLYLLLLVNQRTYRTATRGRLILGAAAGAVLYFLPFLCVGPVWFRFLTGMLAGMGAMIFVTFRVRSLRAFGQIAGRLAAYSFLLGGCLLFLIKSLPFFRKFLTGTFGILLVGAVLFLLLFYRGKESQSSLCRVTLIHRGCRRVVTALLDSGNSLTEPVSGKPVSILDSGTLQELLQEASPYFRAIPYHSIGKKHGILKGYLLEEIRLELNGVVRVCRNVYVASGEEDISVNGEGGDSAVRMILNPLLLK